MRTQPAQIVNIVTGPTELFLVAPQYDEHCRGYKFFQFVGDYKIRQARVDAAAREIIARARSLEQFQEAAE